MYLAARSRASPRFELDTLSSWIAEEEPSCGRCDAPIPLDLLGGIEWHLAKRGSRPPPTPPGWSPPPQRLYLEPNDGSGVRQAARTQKHVAQPREIDIDAATTREVDQLLPTLARDAMFIARVQELVAKEPTTHRLRRGDARDLSFLPDASVQLAVTSPPYWTLKEYNHVAGQLGDVQAYQEFHAELSKVWKECLRVLIPGGRLVVVVGDVVVSRRSALGRHKNFPLHASIQVNCEELGFDNLTPIFWQKIANARFEAEGNGAGFLGKPFEPGSIVKNDTEFILMLRKPGGYRSPAPRERLLSVISADNHKKWFSQLWNDIPGASTKDHPAPFPPEIAERLVRMFSFVGDMVLDPFLGTGSTPIAAMRCGRNSVGVEIDPSYLRAAGQRVQAEAASLFGKRKVVIEGNPR